MKKRNLVKLILNKETIASLNRIEMNESHGGGNAKAVPSRIGATCYTGACCNSRRVCEIKGNGN
jgi:hypothetical protein